jgi:hypothetical protein
VVGAGDAAFSQGMGKPINRGIDALLPLAASSRAIVLVSSRQPKASQSVWKLAQPGDDQGGFDDLRTLGVGTTPRPTY